MKRRLKLLLADLLIGAVTLIIGCPLWWIGMLDYCKASLSRLRLSERRIMRADKQKGEQLI